MLLPEEALQKGAVKRGRAATSDDPDILREWPGGRKRMGPQGMEAGSTGEAHDELGRRGDLGYLEKRDAENLASGLGGGYRAPMRPMRRVMSAAAGGLVSGLLTMGVVSPAAADPSELPRPFGWDYGDIETTRIAALGGALRATGNGTSGVFMNPATMAQTRVYHIEALLDAAPETGRVLAGLVIADSMMNRYRLAGGVSVVGGIFDPSGADFTTLDVRAALAYPITERVFLGVAGRYATMSQGSELPPPNGTGEGDVSTLSIDAFTFDAGLTVKAGQAFYIALLGQNLAATHRGTFPMMLGGGIGYGTKEVTFEVDALADLHSYETTSARVMAGGEVLVADHVPIRVGYRFDQGAKIHALSGGLGYVGTEFAIEASVRRTLSDPGATSIYVSLAYYLESSSLMRAATDGYD
jgi:opacity protein-like surface antigen